MARIRTVKPEFFEDETVGSLSREARLLFIASWTLADDEGLLRWTPAYVKATVFMYDDDLRENRIQRVMEELTGADLVFPYVGGKAGQRLGYIVNFRKHQRINRPQPGRLPPPSLQSSATVQMYAKRDGWECHICQQPVSPDPLDWKTDHVKPSLDHVTPRSEGGDDYPSNIRLTHCSCNKSRGNRSVNDSVNESPLEGNGKEQGTGKGRERKGTSSEFDRYWFVYPRKVGKRTAQAAFQSATKRADAETIIAAAASLAADPNLPDEQFIPHPATWLNRDGWEDGPLPERNGQYRDPMVEQARRLGLMREGVADEHDGVADGAPRSLPAATDS